ncbi:hypothetical protein [uncultured Sneathiella sp.]|uniref:virion core protein, T7 gp14 family n=1 Tax=uncultured Sneathiella sp. TaxID=879315 RepID=UPI0030EC9299|tara:strand:+ start:1405 stop:1950 length:546 start_codon:yes stop_codon:yes gene_type:complete
MTGATTATAVAGAGMSWGTIASIGFSALGAVSGAMGARQQAQAAQQQANFQASVQRNNAIIAQQNAADVRNRGEVEAQEHRDRIRQTRGAVVASQAANGFLVDDPGSSNVDLLADVMEAGELDVLRIEENTAREERRALIQGQNFTAQAGLFDAQASAQNPGLAGATTLLSGAAKTAKLFA